MINVKSLLSISLFLFLLSCQDGSESAGPEDLQKSYYSAAVLNEICPDAYCDSIRFYNSRFRNQGTETLMSIGVEDGADMNSSRYYYFRKIGNSGPKYTRLSERRAKRRSLIPAEGNRYAVTFSKAELLGLLEDEAIEGIAFTHTLSGEGLNTLVAEAAQLSDTIIVSFERPPIVSENPCPTYCGPKPNDDFIWGSDIEPSPDDEDPKGKDS